MRFAAFLTLLITAPAILAAQASNTVPLQDPVYRDIDRLVGNGYVQSVLVGQKPFTRREIARIIAAAERDSSVQDDAPAKATLARLHAEYARELRALAGVVGDTTARGGYATVRDVRAEVLGVSAARRAVPSRPVGKIEADIAPLLNGRAGRVFRDGTNAALEAGLEFVPSSLVAFQARPRVIVNENAGSTFAEGELQAASGTLLFRNIALQAGRDQFVWGQGMEGGLLGSTSGRPLDMVRIFTDTAARFPLVSWLFHADRVRATVMFVDLGPNQNFPHANIIAYKLSGNAFSKRLEGSASVLSEQGGRGAADASFQHRIIDLLPILQYTLPSGWKSHDQISNKIAGWEYRFHIPEWSGLQLYAEHQFEDMDPRRWRSTLWDDGGHIAGLSFARIGALRDWSATAEYHHTGIRYYEHNVWSSGVTFNRTMLGDPLGPEANAGYLRLNWSRGGPTEVQLDVASEFRSGDVYDAVEKGVPPNETDFHFVLQSRGPTEQRTRSVLTWAYRPSAGARLVLAGGYEHVNNFAFVQGTARNGFLANLAFEWRPQ